MRGLPQKQNARRADKIRLCGHLRRYKKIVKKIYIISDKFIFQMYMEWGIYGSDHLYHIFGVSGYHYFYTLEICSFETRCL